MEPPPQGRRFYCREWVFQKLQRCLQERASPAPVVQPPVAPGGAGPRAGGPAWGVLLVGGPGSGKTAVCRELLFPSRPQGALRGLQHRSLAFHFCHAHDADTLSVGRFVRGLLDQLRRGGLAQELEEALRDPAALSLLQPGACESNPTEAFKRCVLLPLLSLKPPPQPLFLLVDSVDEGCQLDQVEPRTGVGSEAESRTAAGSGAGSEAEPMTEGGSCRSIAELLASHHQLLPPWLLLICSARRQNRAVTKLFTGCRKISLDDLRKAYVVKDVQQYILHRLDQEEALRQHLTKETAEMLNQLHIKSSGCFLYLERVLDGVADGCVQLREVRHIPGTLNGLYLWLCQRLFVRKRFARVRPVLSVMLAARRPLAARELYRAAWCGNTALTPEEFRRKMDALSRLLAPAGGDARTLFHRSFAEWLQDVKHCTRRYLCTAADGHRMLAALYTRRAKRLQPHEVQEFAHHLLRADLGLQLPHLALWMVWSGTPSQDSHGTALPEEQEVLQLLVKAGALVSVEEDQGSRTVRQALQREDSTQSLLDSGASVNQSDSGGRTLLARAAHSGNLGVVALLAGRGADLELADGRGQTPLTLAARQGHAKVVGCLIDSGAHVDHSDCEGWTALRSAAWGGHGGVVSALLRAGARVDCPDAEGRTALRAAAWGGHEDIVLDLLRHGARVNQADGEGRTALIAAAYMGHRRIVEHLLDHSAQPDHQDSDGRTALSVAALCVPASRGHASVVGLLIERGAAVDLADKDGMTPLLVAAYEGQAEVVDLLLEGGADVDHADGTGRTALLAAASMGHAAVVNALLFWGAAVDSIDREGRTVLCVAAAQGSVEVVRTLLDRGLDESHRDDAGWAPLHMAAFEGHRAVCQALVEQGARCSEVDNDGRIPLVLAAQEGHYGCVQVLLDGLADPDQRGYDGKNALRVATLEGHTDIAELLLGRGADIDCKDADGRPTLYVLALDNQLTAAEYFLESGADTEASDPEGRTALHVASWQGHLDMVRLLVGYGAEVNAADGERRSALQSAAWRGHAAVVQFLMDGGARVDHACQQGATALCIAAQEGHAEVVRALLERGADPNHADQFGRTATRVATRGGHAHIIQLLEKHGATGQAGGSPTVGTARPPQTKPSAPARAFRSRSDSPSSTAEQRNSPTTRSLSNHSLGSSRNSSGRTSSSSTATAQTAPVDSLPVASFAGHIRQHSLPRTHSRGRRTRVAPVSADPSPTREGKGVRVQPSLKLPKGGKSGKGTSGGSVRLGTGRRKLQNGPGLEYEMSQLKAGVKGPLCKIVSQQGGPGKNQGSTIVTNSPFHPQERHTLERYPIRESELNRTKDSELYQIREPKLSLKQALMLSEAPDPSFSCKKETPL